MSLYLEGVSTFKGTIALGKGGVGERKKARPRISFVAIPDQALLSYQLPSMRVRAYVCK